MAAWVGFEVIPLLGPDFSVGRGGGGGSGWSGLDGAEWIPDSEVVGTGLEGTVGGGPSGKIPKLSAVLLNPTNGCFPTLGPAVLEESLASGVLLTVGLNPLKSDVMVRSWTSVAVTSVRERLSAGLLLEAPSSVVPTSRAGERLGLLLGSSCPSLSVRLGMLGLASFSALANCSAIC